MRNHRPSELQLLHWQAIVEIGGGLFRGVQQGYPELNLEPLVLFDDAGVPRKERSTMAIKPSALCAEAVRKLIAAKRKEYEAQYEAYAEKAALFVFRQFAQPEAK